MTEPASALSLSLGPAPGPAPATPAPLERARHRRGSVQLLAWFYSDWAALRSLQALANQSGIALEPEPAGSVTATLGADPPQRR